MGIMGQLPSRPDVLPGREVTTGEPPDPHRGPRADELPTLQSALGSVRSHSISLPRPAAPAADQPDHAADSDS